MTTIRVQRVSISIMIALFIATLTFMTVQAATTVLSEQGNRFFYWYGPTINNASMLGCRTSGGVTNYNCKWKNQVSSNESMYFWGANQPNVTKWYAYVPSDADVAVNYSAHIMIGVM